MAFESTPGCLLSSDKTRRYNPPTRPRVDRANYIIIDEHTPIQEGYTLLAPGASVAVETLWLDMVLLSVGPPRTDRKVPNGSEILKRLMDGFYEPWELGVTGGSDCFEGNTIYESLKCYAMHTLQMDLSSFRRVWNQKMGTSRRTVKRLQWKNHVDSLNDAIPKQSEGQNFEST